jgi:RNase P subunit RPR2
MIKTIPTKPRRAVKVVAPIQSPPLVQYRDLSDLDHLISSKAGYFWCYTHLADLPLKEQSPDPRYCRQCYAILQKAGKEAKRSRNKIWWWPKPINRVSRSAVRDAAGVIRFDPLIGKVSGVTLICQGCGAIIPYKRTSKRYCSNRCRLAHQRGQMVMAVSS